MNVKQLVHNTSARQWKEMTGKQVREAYQTLKHALKERSKTFAKHGEEMKRVLPSSRGLTEGQIRQKAMSAAAYMRGDVSSYKGWQKSASKKLQDMQEAMPEMKFETVNDVRKFGKFMNEMKDRYSIIQYDSDEAKKIYQASMRKNQDPDEVAKLFFEEGTRLGVSPSKFMRNYEYWKENAEYLSELTPIKKRAGSRATKPSDYARQIERIKKNRRGS